VVRVLYPGSFDPPHLGHVSVIARLASEHDEVIVAAVGNPAKTRFLSLEQRRDLLLSLVAPWGNVEVVTHDGLLVDLARRLHVTALARAAGKEAHDELLMAAMNQRVSSVPTIFVAPDADVAAIGSRQVRELVLFGRRELARSLVPPLVFAALPS
jgi:pantetheine-phosphate adenylyltransferase